MKTAVGSNGNKMVNRILCFTMARQLSLNQMNRRIGILQAGVRQTEVADRCFKKCH